MPSFSETERNKKAERMLWKREPSVGIFAQTLFDPRTNDMAIRTPRRIARRTICCARTMNSSMLLLIVFTCFASVRATIYLDNESIPSLPALFGRFMVNGKLYTARLQFLPENKYLCDSTNITSFVRPAVISENVDITEPVALLASRGNCPFSRKAAVAAAIDPSVQFLIVYNYDLEGEDTVVPMYTENGDSRLVLLSITHRAGQALRQYLLHEPSEVHDAGGPSIALDSTPPPGMLSKDDMQQMIMSAVGVFFIMVSFSGCVMILVGTYGQLQANGHVVFTLDGSSNNANSTFGRQNRLSEEQVLQLPSSNGEEGSHSCAICLDEEPSPEVRWTELPCQHHFHTECIVPWLTERQAKCPLCKCDVLQHVRENLGEDEALCPSNTTTSSPISSLWTRMTRYRRIQASNGEDATDGNHNVESERIVEVELSTPHAQLEVV